MGDFDRGFNRRPYNHSAPPPHQRSNQWDEPRFRQTDHYPGAHQFWREENWRNFPPHHQWQYWEGAPLPPYHRERERPYNRDYHPAPRQREYHRDRNMGKKKGQVSRAAPDDTHAQKEGILLAEDPNAIPPTSKPAGKRSKSNPSNGKNKTTIVIPDGDTENEEDKGLQGNDSVKAIEQTISEACRCMGLERGTKLIIEASTATASELKCSIPTASSQLTRRIVRYSGTQDKPWELPVKNSSPGTMVVLDPILDEAPAFSTSTLAQEFIRNPHKRWLREDDPKFLAGIPYFEKYLIWARMMLLSEEDKKVLDHADVLRGIFGSLFRVPKIWPLIQAFLDFWNVDGHTIITRQGEMGYSLRTRCVQVPRRGCFLV